MSSESVICRIFFFIHKNIQMFNNVLLLLQNIICDKICKNVPDLTFFGNCLFYIFWKNNKS